MFFSNIAFKLETLLPPEPMSMIDLEEKDVLLLSSEGFIVTNNYNMFYSE